MTLCATPDCETCTKRDSRLCSAIQARSASVWPLLPEADTLFPGGEPTDVSLRGGRFGVLQSGLLMRCGGEGGMDLVSPGEPLGEAFRGNREMRVSAIVPSEICWFDVHDIEAAALRDVRLGCALLDASTAAVERREAFLRLRAARTVAERYAGLLLMVADQVAERGAGGTLRLTLACRRDDIALLLGTTGTDLELVRQQMVDSGLVALHGPLTLELLDIAALEELAGIEAVVPATLLRAHLAQGKARREVSRRTA